jgi:hypothetical protein
VTWAKATNIATGEVHYDLTPEALDPDVYTIELLEGEPVEPQRQERLGALDALLEAKDTGTCLTPVSDVPVKLDEKTKAKILGALSLCRLKEELTEAFAVNFTMADESRIALDNTTVRQLAGAVGEYVAAIHDHADVLRQAILAATTVDDLNAIDITTGWP